MSAQISFALRDSRAAISVPDMMVGGWLWYVSSRDGRLCIYRVPVKATDSCCYEKGIKGGDAVLEARENDCRLHGREGKRGVDSCQLFLESPWRPGYLSNLTCTLMVQKLTLMYTDSKTL